MPTVAEILTMLMAREGLSDNELAERTGIPQPTISRIKSGDSRDPRDSTLRPLAKYFRLSISQLRGDVPLPTDKVKVAANDEVTEVSRRALMMAQMFDRLSPEQQDAMQTLFDSIAQPKVRRFGLKAE
ncbi:MAG: peptidase S24-like domain protein [Proteobacteria bacterium]|nr:peptidase S24-like domain protein [Pseudomonadota bacterium]